MRMNSGSDEELTTAQRQEALLLIAEKIASDAARSTEAAQKIIDRLPKILEETVGPAATAGARTAVWQQAHEALADLQGTVDKLGGTIAKLDNTASQVKVLAPQMAMRWLVAGVLLSLVAIVGAGIASYSFSKAGTAAAIQAATTGGHR